MDMSDQDTAASAGSVTVTEADDKNAAVNTLIDVWHREHFSGSPTTELWNASFAAKEDLKKRIAAL
jgi:hypothetical protein